VRLFKLCEGALFIARGVNEDVEAERWPGETFWLRLLLLLF